MEQRFFVGRLDEVRHALDVHAGRRHQHSAEAPLGEVRELRVTPTEHEKEYVEDQDEPEVPRSNRLLCSDDGDEEVAGENMGEEKRERVVASDGAICDLLVEHQNVDEKPEPEHARADVADGGAEREHDRAAGERHHHVENLKIEEISAGSLDDGAVRFLPLGVNHERVDAQDVLEGDHGDQARNVEGVGNDPDVAS